MATTLEFQLDARELERLRRDWPQPAGALEETYLEFPVRFAVGDAELMQWTGNPLTSVMIAGQGEPAVEVLRLSSPNSWRFLPVLHLLTGIPGALAEAESAGTGRLYLPGGGGWLEFRMAGETLTVHCTDNGATGVASMADVRGAFIRFRRDLSAVLLENLPQLAADPRWRALLSPE